MSSPLIFSESSHFPPLSFLRVPRTNDQCSAPVPKKQTQDIDFTPYLRSIIQRTYGESPDNYSEAMGALNRARQDALRGVAGSDSTGRDLLLKYFGMLEWLELKFTDLRVPFPWFV